MRGGVHEDADVAQMTQRQTERDVSLLFVERHDAHLGAGDRDECGDEGQRRQQRAFHGNRFYWSEWYVGSGFSRTHLPVVSNHGPPEGGAHVRRQPRTEP